MPRSMTTSLLFGVPPNPSLQGRSIATRTVSRGARIPKLRLGTHASSRPAVGVPMFVLDGELFWGGDRIGMFEERLRELGLG